jgi:hypothetical protein
VPVGANVSSCGPPLLLSKYGIDAATVQIEMPSTYQVIDVGSQSIA